MIRKSHLSGGLLLICLLFLLASLAPADTPLAAQQLQGAAAEQFLARAGILSQIAPTGLAAPAAAQGFPVESRGRNYLEPHSYIAAPVRSNDQFGYSLALAGDTLLVGAPYANEGTNFDQGAVYLFTRDNGEANAWSQQHRLTAGDGGAADHFGVSVALAGDTAVIGAPGHNLGSNADRGAAYVFVCAGDQWSEQAKLTAGDGAAGDNFGAALAITGDTILAGAPLADVGANSDQGAAYLFERSGDTWSELLKLTAASGSQDNRFGSAVALDQDTVLIGADRDDLAGNMDQGSAYIFALIGGSWLEWQRLTAGDGAAGDYFGGSVALAGDAALIGAEGDDLGANAEQGSAYIFVRTDSAAVECGIWNEHQKLTAGDGQAGDAFGSAVALYGNTALIGAHLDNVVENANQGSAYVFTRELGGATWSDGQRLADSAGAASDFFGAAVAIEGDTIAAGAPGVDILTLEYAGRLYTTVRGPTPWPETDTVDSGDGYLNGGFGYSLALDGDTALIGAPWEGSALVFVRSGGVWSEQARLTGGSSFAMAVALDGDTALIGAPDTNVGGNFDQGAAYVFVRSGDVWSFQQQLIASDGGDDDEFGDSVAVEGDMAIVGAPFDVVGGNEYQGSAYVFVRSGSAWSETQKLTAGDGAAEDVFGAEVALDGDAVIIGAPGADVPPGTAGGAAYVFTRSAGQWNEQQKLTAGDPASRDFGSSVALDGETALVGDPSEYVAGSTNRGTAYVFTRAGDGWSIQQKLTAEDWEAGYGFGSSVAVYGGIILVGVPYADVAGNIGQGAAYLYAWNGSNWVWEQKLLSANGAPGIAGAHDEFGLAVALDGEIALVGAWRADVDGVVNRGRAHFFERGDGAGYRSYLPAALKD